jgi:hypothetical protein
MLICTLIGTAVNYVLEEHYYQTILSGVSVTWKEAGTWIVPIVASLVILFRAFSCLFFMFIRSHHSEVVSEITRKQNMQRQIEHT